MSITRIIKRGTIDHSLFMHLDKCNSVSLQDNELVFKCNSDNKRTLELRDIFIYNILQLEIKDDSYLSFSAHSAASLKPFVLYLSKRFPEIIVSERMEIEWTLKMCRGIIKDRLDDDGKKKSFTYIEENERLGMVNLFSVNDMDSEAVGIKIDIDNNRIFTLMDSKLALCSIDFLTYENEPNYLNMILEDVNVGYRL